MDNIHMGSEPKSHGALVGSIIIVLILIVGGVYYYKSAKTQVAKDQIEATQVSQQADMQVQTLSTQGTSDTIADIEADLNTTDINTLTVQ
jgi:uncharacterized protein YpmB